MSVLVVTSLGEMVVDLFTDRCPLTTKNFLKLCKMKYYNGCLFHKVEKDFLAQTGDRTGTGTGGESVYKFLYGEQARFFDDEVHPDLKHKKIGTVAMASAGENGNASQFYFTLREDLDYLDGKHTVFGAVEEGLDTLTKINEAFVDEKGRPYKNIRVKHTYILDDPFPDPPQLTDFIPEKSPEGKPDDEVAEERLEDNWVPLEETLGAAELEELLREREAHTNAAILESIGDIPDADMKPPDNVLFVCKLNPVTQDEDLYTIFSRFGTVVSADIIRDYKTGDSLCYAFIEFETKESCELAYIKMDNTLIDDRRIHVDFSQSVAKLWGQYRHGKRSAGSGCFKCGATDHMAKDCSEGSNKNDRQSKYVLKSGDAQRGGGRKNYDMVFDEDERGRSHKNSDETRGAKRYKADASNAEEFRQRISSGQDSDSRSYRSAPDHGDATSREKNLDEKRPKHHESGRNDKDSDGHREHGRMNGDKRDRYGYLGSRHGRDGEEHTRNKEQERESKGRREYEERKSDRYNEYRESSRHHHRDRHERYADEPRKRSSETDHKKYESVGHTVNKDKEEQRYRSKHGEDDSGQEKRHRHDVRR